MKKSSLYKTFGLTALGFTLIAAASQLDMINQGIANALDPLVQNGVKISFAFSKAEVDAVAARDVAAEFNYSRMGKNNGVEIKMNGSYSNPASQPAPKLAAAVLLKTDLRKIMGDDIDEMLSEADALVLEFTKQMTQDYGTAVKADAHIVDKQVDSNGKITSMTLHFEASLDLANLPEGKPVENEMWKNIVIEATLNGSEMSVQLEMTINEKAANFDQNQVGLKEAVEALAAQDEALLADIAHLGAFVDYTVGQLLNDETDTMGKIVKMVHEAVK